MKRNKIREMIHISGENDPEPQNVRKESITDKITEFVIIYLPEIIFGALFLRYIREIFDITSNNFLVSIMFCVIIYFYIVLTPLYLNVLQNHTVVNAIKLWNFVYIAIKDDEIIEILCMDEDKFNIEVFKETNEAYRIEKIK